MVKYVGFEISDFDPAKMDRVFDDNDGPHLTTQGIQDGLCEVEDVFSDDLVNSIKQSWVYVTKKKTDRTNTAPPTRTRV